MSCQRTRRRSETQNVRLYLQLGTVKYDNCIYKITPSHKDHFDFDVSRIITSSHEIQLQTYLDENKLGLRFAKRAPRRAYEHLDGRRRRLGVKNDLLAVSLSIAAYLELLSSAKNLISPRTTQRLLRCCRRRKRGRILR